MCSSKAERLDALRFIGAIYIVIMTTLLLLSKGSIGVYVVMGLHKVRGHGRLRARLLRCGKNARLAMLLRVVLQTA